MECQLFLDNCCEKLKGLNMPEDLIDEVIPLDKLISRLRTDLKLSKNYADKYGEPSSHEIKHKNKQKLSLLYYLELLKEVQPGL